MPKDKIIPEVTMRLRVGSSELEITGPSDYVEKKIAEFLSRESASLAAPAQAAVPVTGSGSSVATPVAGAKPKSPAQFFKAVKPKTDTDRVLVSAYYLEKYRQAQNATAAEIRDLISEAKWQPPSNTSDAINKNIRKGFLMTAGDRENKMAFVVTSDGEALVEGMADANIV